MPSGTYVSIPEDMIVGIHWANTKKYRIDLDLSLLSVSGKFGWDGAYRSRDGEILFSGDITDAPNGATELFYVKKRNESNHLMCINYYNYDEDTKVPFKIIVASEKPSDFGENYMVNQNNILANIQSGISTKQKVSGLLSVTPTGTKFYFIETALGNLISSRNNEYTKIARKYLINYNQNSIELKDILIKAGADVVSESTIHRDKSDCDIDLSPESIEKDTILNLLIKGE